MLIAIECQILITEAKKQNMDYGFAQCGIQLDSAEEAGVLDPQKTLRYCFDPRHLDPLMLREWYLESNSPSAFIL